MWFMMVYIPYTLDQQLIRITADSNLQLSADFTTGVVMRKVGFSDSSVWKTGFVLPTFRSECSDLLQGEDETSMRHLSLYSLASYPVTALDRIICNCFFSAMEGNWLGKWPIKLINHNTHTAGQKPKHAFCGNDIDHLAGRSSVKAEMVSEFCTELAF